MMPGITVVLLYSDRVFLSDHMALRGKNFSEGIPIISIKNAIRQVLDFIIESLECCSITITDNPCNGSPCATIQGFDDP